jgi:8-oxo-dGTP diphosphatase
MRRRPSATLLLLDEENRVLLFRFVYKNGALAGRDYWATPEGGLEGGETFEEGAKRELN